MVFIRGFIPHEERDMRSIILSNFWLYAPWWCGGRFLPSSSLFRMRLSAILNEKFLPINVEINITETRDSSRWQMGVWYGGHIEKEDEAGDILADSLFVNSKKKSHFMEKSLPSILSGTSIVKRMRSVKFISASSTSSIQISKTADGSEEVVNEGFYTPEELHGRWWKILILSGKNGQNSVESGYRLITRAEWRTRKQKRVFGTNCLSGMKIVFRWTQSIASFAVLNCFKNFAIKSTKWIGVLEFAFCCFLLLYLYARYKEFTRICRWYWDTSRYWCLFWKGRNTCILGKNGSGKSSLASIIMGNPAYEVTEWTISRW